MTEKNTHNKLVPKLGSDEIAKTRIKFKLKFTDFAIKNYTANFINEKGKILKRVTCPFDTGSGKSFLKGLKLAQYFKTKNKFFMLRYWFNSKSDDVSLGQFEEGIFGVKECQEKLFDLVKDHTNSKGLWIKDPKLTLNAANNNC